MSHQDRMLEIVRRREQLLAQCEAQREDLAAIARRSSGALGTADRVVGVFRYFRRHPLMLGAVVAALVVVQRRGLWGWLQRGFLLWQAYRRLRSSRFALKF